MLLRLKLFIFYTQKTAGSTVVYCSIAQ